MNGKPRNLDEERSLIELSSLSLTMNENCALLQDLLEDYNHPWKGEEAQPVIKDRRLEILDKIKNALGVHDYTNQEIQDT